MLFYYKTGPVALLDACQMVARAKGYRVELIQYGHYQPAEYLEKLHSNLLAVFFSESESQGIALLEAWAADLPTLVWNPGYITVQEKDYAASSAPYLSDQTGLFFKDVEMFQQVLAQWEAHQKSFQPRAWVLNTMTDAHSAQMLLSLIPTIL